MYGEELLNVFAVFPSKLNIWVSDHLLDKTRHIKTSSLAVENNNCPLPLFSDILKTEKSINWKVIDRLTARENKSELLREGRKESDEIG